MTEPYLRDQAGRAERLARSVMDTLTVDRLQAFAADLCNVCSWNPIATLKATTDLVCKQPVRYNGGSRHRALPAA
jgi:hypothetical protein